MMSIHLASIYTTLRTQMDFLRTRAVAGTLVAVAALTLGACSDDAQTPVSPSSAPASGGWRTTTSPATSGAWGCIH